MQGICEYNRMESGIGKLSSNTALACGIYFTQITLGKS